MKFLPFILKHLRYKWGRTLTTVLAMALCIFLFCTLQGILAAIDDLMASTSAKRLITRHAVSLVFNVPLSYQSRIASVPGVKRVAITSWFGGSLPAKKEGKAQTEDEDEDQDELQSTTDWSQFFTNMAVEPEPFFAMSPEYPVAPDQFRDFKKTIVMVTHDPRAADRAHKQRHLEKGVLVDDAVKTGAY